MKKLDKRLLRMVAHTKGQFISVTVIVAVALCMYIAFSMLSINIKDSVKTYYEETNFSHINVQLIKMPVSALKDISKISGIKSVEGRISFNVPLKVENSDEKVTVRILSIPKGGNTINKLYMTGGKPLSHLKDVIVLDQFAKARQIKPGDNLSPYINGVEQEFTVSGIAANPEFIYLMENEQALLPAPEKFGILFMEEEYAQTLFGYGGYYNELLITVYNEDKIDEISEKLEKELDEYGIKRIIPREKQLSNDVINQKMAGIEKANTAVPVIFLMVAALIISIMLSRTVSNDRIPIGVLKAMGYGNANILLHYTKYSLLIGMTGSIIGILIGLLLSNVLTQVFIGYFNIPIVKFNVYYTYVLYGIILSSMFCILSGLFGARSILSIMPADSMRPEAPKSGKRVLLEKVAFLWKRLSFSWKMVIRDISRTKKRFIFLVLGLSLAYAINVVPIYMVSAFPTMFTLQYGKYQKMDYSLEFSAPLNDYAITDLKHLAKIDVIEPKVEFPFELQNGWKKKAVGIIGLQNDTSFYEFRNMEDKQIKLKENEILITEALAEYLEAERGDTIQINNFIPDKKDAVVKIGDIIKQYMGINAYMSIETMNKLLLDKNMMTGVLIQSKDDLKQKFSNVKKIAAVRSVSDMKNAFLEYMDTMIVSVWFFMFFGGVLGFAIVYNSTIIGIAERNMEFASLRVMGFDKMDIYKMVAKENAILTIISIMLGIPIGIGMIQGVAKSFSSELITLPVILEGKAFILAALATLVFVAAAQFAAYKKIQNLNFIDALKSRIS